MNYFNLTFIVLIGLSFSVHSTAYEQAYAFSGLGVSPSIQAELKLNGNKFEQVVRISFPAEITLQKIRSKSLNGSLMKEISGWVSEAKFGKVNNETKNFSLVIGKNGVSFIHNFKCQEVASVRSWGIECLSHSNKKNEKSVILRARRAIFCELSKNEKLIACEYEMSGVAEDVSVFFSKFSGAQIAFALFIEDTSYLARLSLMISTDSLAPSEIRDVFLESGYPALINDLKSQMPNFKNFVPEIVVASAI